MYTFNQNAFEIRSGNEQLSTSIVWGTVPREGLGRLQYMAGSCTMMQGGRTPQKKRATSATCGA